MVRVLVLPRKVIISFRSRLYFEIYIHVFSFGAKINENLLIQAFMMLCQTTTFGKLLYILMRSTYIKIPTMNHNKFFL